MITFVSFLSGEKTSATCFVARRFSTLISAYSIIIPMSDPTSTVTSSAPSDIHESAITSNDSNDIIESLITSTVHIEPPDGPSSTPHVEQHSVPSCVHQLLLDSTPGGSELWTRKMVLSFKPHIGEFFGTLEEAISFYGVYAEACRFEPRRSSQKRSYSGDVQYKFVVCNREAFRDRKRKAIILHSGEEQATPKAFNIRNTKLTRISCTTMIEFRYNGDGHLHLYHRKTIIDHSRVNQGPTTAFRNVKEYVDGYENVGAQLDKSDTNEGFYFAYEVDSENVCTNKYCMVFTPFTRVDHHKRSVTFAATLLFHEDEDSFKWVFEKFLDAMGQREPHCIITDQCARIELGLRAVFKHARRRYCMWHIMKKRTDKVGPAISKETDFVSRLNAIVWDAELEPLEFEEKWSQLVNEHNLEVNSWLSTMFRKRRKWIPAYFRDIPTGCLLRTTQRSESQNNFFNRFENAHGTLVEFWMRFQSAIDGQRHSQKQLDRDDDCTLPQLSTSLKLEAHASKLYTHSTYADFQLKLLLLFVPFLLVASHLPTLFNIKGIICRHIIWVYSGKQVDTLPDKKLEMCKLWSEFYATISVLKNVPNNEITDLADTLKQFRVKLNPQSESMTKEQKLEMLLGCSSSTEVRILPPRQAKNKGSGKRMISKKQQCIAKVEKPKRLYNNCKQMAHHDKRNYLMLLYPMPTIIYAHHDKSVGVQMQMMLMMVDRLKDFSIDGAH
ncbi:protein FAR1-RELATED SEQUENCE 5-like [Silene latifolia]|uniref:protein FAR1-RELATED SEQUENCE 5-like n=1 Tax=Silene latifolia TaxID=37657 RepID=UPI003D7792B6